jgi:hypothetical protein
MERERTVVTALLLLQLVLWLGFFVHRSPRFPGSVWGGALAVPAALLMLVPLAYTLIRRVKSLKEKVTARLPLSRLLTWHLYTSTLGAILAILHTGHRFQSWMGILLTTAMLLAILSGYVGRHFLRYVSQEMRERQDTLVALRAAYDELAGRIVALPGPAPTPTLVSGLRGRLAAAIGGAPQAGEPTGLRVHAMELAEAMADTEYAIAANDAIKRRLRAWLIAHVGTSTVFYMLLTLHIGASVQYGLRWFS